jgi:hypothetical protein
MEATDMAIIAYVGTSDYRGLSKADLEKYSDGDSVDFGDMKFSKHPTDPSDRSRQLWFPAQEPVEVPDAVAEVLFEHDHFAGEFTFLDEGVELEDDEDPADNEGARDAASKAAKKAAKKATKSSNASTPTREGKAATATGGGGTAGTTGGTTGSGSGTGDGSGVSTGGTRT